MRRVRFGGSDRFIYILGPGEAPFSHAANFTQDEYDWALRLASAKNDQDEREAFWEGIVERKLESPAYSVFDGYPAKIEFERPKAPAPGEPNYSLASIHCRAIIEGLENGTLHNVG